MHMPDIKLTIFQLSPAQPGERSFERKNIGPVEMERLWFDATQLSEELLNAFDTWPTQLTNKRLLAYLLTTYSNWPTNLPTHQLTDSPTDQQQPTNQLSHNYSNWPRRKFLSAHFAGHNINQPANWLAFTLALLPYLPPLCQLLMVFHSVQSVKHVCHSQPCFLGCVHFGKLHFTFFLICRRARRQRSQSPI